MLPYFKNVALIINHNRIGAIMDCDNELFIKAVSKIENYSTRALFGGAISCEILPDRIQVVFKKGSNFAIKMLERPERKEQVEKAFSGIFGNLPLSYVEESEVEYVMVPVSMYQQMLKNADIVDDMRKILGD